MCQSSQQQYVAVTGIANITTANSALDGTGATSLVFTAGANGSVLKSITIKATVNNAQGMIRFFINISGTKMLWKEIPVPVNIQSVVTTAYQTTVKTSYILQPGATLYAATQNAESWNIIVEGINWTNCPCTA